MANKYDKDETFELCDSLGVEVVREYLKSGKFHVGQAPHAEIWLYLYDSSVKDRAEERSEEKLSISRWANIWKAIATLIAVIALYAAIFIDKS